MDDVPADPFRGRAIDAEVTGRSEPPKTLEICRRRVEPGTVTRNVCRSVVFSKTMPVSFCDEDCVSVRAKLLPERVVHVSECFAGHGFFFLTNGAGGRFAGSVSCGIEAQMSTHFPLLPVCFSGLASAKELSNSKRITVTWVRSPNIVFVLYITTIVVLY